MKEICDAMFCRFCRLANVELISVKIVPVSRIATIMPPSRNRWSLRYPAVFVVISPATHDPQACSLTDQAEPSKTGWSRRVPTGSGPTCRAATTTPARVRHPNVVAGRPGRGARRRCDRARARWSVGVLRRRGPLRDLSPDRCLLRDTRLDRCDPAPDVRCRPPAFAARRCARPRAARLAVGDAAVLVGRAPGSPGALRRRGADHWRVRLAGVDASCAPDRGGATPELRRAFRRPCDQCRGGTHLPRCRRQRAEYLLGSDARRRGVPARRIAVSDAFCGFNVVGVALLLGDVLGDVLDPEPNRDELSRDRRALGRVRFPRRKVRAVDDVSMSVERGGVLALVGESGSGKSTIGRAVVGTLDVIGGRVTAGEIRLDGVDLLRLTACERRMLRGRRIALVPQDPLSVLNPLQRVVDQVAEPMRIHERGRECAVGAGGVRAPCSRRDTRSSAGRARNHTVFRAVSASAPMIVMAIALSPEVIVADEPTTALDATVQAEVLELLVELQRDLGHGTAPVSHDLGLVESIADTVVVMYAGRSLVGAARGALSPAATPVHGRAAGRGAAARRDRRRRQPIGANRHGSTIFPPVCAFHPPVSLALVACRTSGVPQLRDRRRRLVACHFPLDR